MTQFLSSGQAAAMLAKRFKRVIATDPSEEQLSHAPEISNVDFRVGSAESTGLSDQSVDLITVGQGLHWFDFPSFWPEARRILKPAGAVAAWGYDIPTFPDHKACTELMHDWYQATLCGHWLQGETRSYWSDRRQHLDNHYIGLEPDSSLFNRCDHKELEMTKEISIASLMGYLSTWSAINTYTQQHPDRPNPVDTFKPEFKKVGGFSTDTDTLKMSHPVFILLCQNT
eukprot:jgi/Astpho2/4935/Aster-06674